MLESRSSRCVATTLSQKLYLPVLSRFRLSVRRQKPLSCLAVVTAHVETPSCRDDSASASNRIAEQVAGLCEDQIGKGCQNSSLQSKSGRRRPADGGNLRPPDDHDIYAASLTLPRRIGRQ